MHNRTVAAINSRLSTDKLRMAKLVRYKLHAQCRVTRPDASVHEIRIHGLDALLAEVDAAGSSSPMPAGWTHTVRSMPGTGIVRSLALVQRSSEAANQSLYQRNHSQISKFKVRARLLSLRAEGISPRALPEPLQPKFMCMPRS